MTKMKLFSRRDKAEMKKLRNETTPTPVVLLPSKSIETAALYTKEEVQKIVENVREAVIKEAEAYIFYDERYDDAPQVDINDDNMRSLDLNQFIKK